MAHNGFNPHPVVGPDATGGFTVLRNASRTSFNPHPVVGPDATPSFRIVAGAREP